MMLKGVSLILAAGLIFISSCGISFAYDPVTGSSGGDEWRDMSAPGESAPAPEPEVKEPVYKPHYGPKKRLAVTKFSNKVKGVYGNWALGDAFAEMLTTELMKTGRFVVIERQALQDIISEQELGQTGLVRKETAAKVGQVLGAQIIVRGVVSEFDMRSSGGGGGIGVKGFRLGLNTSNAHVAVDIRLIDASSGQVLHSHNAAGTAASTGLGLGVRSGDVAIDTEGFKKTPLGQATRDAIHSAVEFIIGRMELIPFEAKVIKFSNGKVYINAGALMNIKPGDKFYAYSKGEELIDPDTGLNLGSEDSLIGTVEVSDVQEKYSIGRILSGSGTLKRGDILRFE